VSGSSPASVAIAWLLTRPGVTSPIVSATSVAQLREVVAGAQLVLEAETVALLDRASATD
jgi:aryl-alcohol dehydrogenase-like predicted oxidoreductase